MKSTWVEEPMWQKCWSKANRSQHFLFCAALRPHTDSLTKFAELAKKHKLACGYIPDPQNPATTNVVIKTEDAELANKIRKDAGIEILPGIDEKKQNASPFASVSQKSTVRTLLRFVVPTSVVCLVPL